MRSYQWLETLHRTHYDTLIRLAKNRLRQSAASVSDAEDIVQQAFLLAAEKDISSHEAPVKWLIKTVNNLCMNRATSAWRSVQKTQRMIGQQTGSSPASSVHPVERQESLTGRQEVLMLIEQTLSPEEWELMRQYCLEDISIDELAARYAMSPVALRVRMHRLRGKLKKEYFGL